MEGEKDYKKRRKERGVADGTSKQSAVGSNPTKGSSSFLLAVLAFACFSTSLMSHATVLVVAPR